MPTDTPPTPSLPPHFTPVREIGRSHTAVIWLATYAVTGQPLAVKVWRRPLGSGAEKETFVNECRWHPLLADHPNIVDWAWASSPDDPNPWIATVPHGIPLASWRKKHDGRPLRLRVALSLDILAGLAAMHSRSLVHGRVTPNAVLVDEEGRAALSDLGVVVPAEEQTRLRPTMARGSVAPELENGANPPSMSSDVYQAAAVLSELLGGDIPDGLDHLVNTVARSPRPEDRPRDAGDFRRRLREAALAAGIPVRETTTEGLGATRPGRRRVAGSVAALILASAVTGGGLVIGYQHLTGSGPGTGTTEAQPTAGARSAGSETPAAPAPPPFARMQNLATGFSLDSDADGSAYTRLAKTGDQQRWQVIPAARGAYTLVNVDSQRCLDSDTSGRVHTAECGGATSQLWTLETSRCGTVVVRDVATGLVLDSNGTPAGDGAQKVLTFHENGGSYQKWSLTPVE